MAINYNPTTVSDGLVLALDAANTRSYPGSGTAWTDISYRGNNGTLTNGPTFVAPPYNEPFGGAGGVYFDGTGDYLSIAHNSALSLGASDFTLEGWMYWSSNNGNWSLFHKVGDWSLIADANRWVYSHNPGVANVLVINWTPVLNTWYHIACVRNGATTTLYVNGVSIGSGSSATTSGATNPLTVGATSTGTYPLNGYISNARIVKGTALYTSNFTPPRVLLSNILNTSLLTCQGGTIRDASSNNFTITANGDASAVSYSPYIKFDGTNDYVLASSSNDFDVSASAYTIEMWVYFNSSPSTVILFGFAGTSTSGNAHLLYQGGTLYWQTRGTGTNQTTYTWTPSTGTWYHLAVSWNGSNSLRVFINGQQVASNTVSPTINQNGVNIGGASDGYSVNGKISLARIYKGKGLTAEEVSQNYNALKGRFGL